MKKLLITLILILFAMPALAQEEQEKEYPGMRVLREGRLKIIVPEDAKIRQERNLTVVETTNAYAARRFEEVEERLLEIDIRLDSLQEQLEEIKETLEELK